MKFLVYAIPTLVGFVLGYFLNTPMIVLVSICTAIAALVMRPKRGQGVGAIIGLVVLIVLGVGSVAMWGTHLYVSSVSLYIPNLSEYILRQQ